MRKEESMMTTGRKPSADPVEICFRPVLVPGVATLFRGSVSRARCNLLITFFFRIAIRECPARP
jgi:hypothetical protein